MTFFILFDIDDALTNSNKKITDEMIGMLYRLKSNNNIDLGLIGGSDYKKLVEQLGEHTINLFKWVFSENGLISFEDGNKINNENIINKCGNISFNHIIDICLEALSNSESTCKRGHFIELRTGMINISPIGRSCSKEEREYFYEQDKIHKYREKLVDNIKRRWERYIYESEEPQIELVFNIGGMISIDIFPKGWDKSYCLNLVHNNYNKIYYFSNQSFQNTNIVNPLIKEFLIKTPEDTIKIINDEFFS